MEQGLRVTQQAENMSGFMFQSLSFCILKLIQPLFHNIITLWCLWLHVFLCSAVSPAPLTSILSAAIYVLFKSAFPSTSPLSSVLHSLFFSVHCLTSFNLAAMCPCLPFSPMCCPVFSVISRGSVIFWRRCGWWVGQKHVQLSSMERRWMMIRGYVWPTPPPHPTTTPV